MKTTLKQLKKHPLYCESDLNYFLKKGDSYDHIKAIWDRDYASGFRTPLEHATMEEIIESLQPKGRLGSKVKKG